MFLSKIYKGPFNLIVRGIHVVEVFINQGVVEKNVSSEMCQYYMPEHTDFV